MERVARNHRVGFRLHVAHKLYLGFIGELAPLWSHIMALVVPSWAEDVWL